MARRTTDTRVIFLPMSEQERVVVGQLTQALGHQTVPAMLRTLITSAAKNCGISVPMGAFVRRQFQYRYQVPPMRRAK